MVYDEKLKPENCPVCLEIGERLYVDFDEDEHWPDWARQLIRDVDDGVNTIEHCPKCLTWYRGTWITDNDIFQPTHTAELVRVSEEYAMEFIQSYKKQKKELEQWEHSIHRRRVRDLRKGIKKRLQKLPEISEKEQKLLDLIIEKENSVTFSEIETGSDFSNSELKEMIKSLRAKNILWTALDFIRNANTPPKADPEPAPDTKIYLYTV